MKSMRLFLLAPLGACVALLSVHSAPPAAPPGPLLADHTSPSVVRVADEETGSLLTNGDFAKGTDGWELLNWGKNTRMQIDPQEMHDGHPALRVDNLAIGHSFVRQTLHGKSHTRYRLSGYIKTENIEPSLETQTSGAILMAGRLGAYTALQAGTNPWTAVSVDFITLDDPTIRVGPSIGTDASFCSGTAWFADLQLIELHGQDEKVRALISKPGNVLYPRPFLLASGVQNFPTSRIMR